MYYYHWARYVISGARYTDSKTLLVEFYLHRESEGGIRPGICRNRQWVLNHLIKGSTFFTLDPGNDNMERKDRIILNQVAGKFYIRTHSSPYPGDDIGYHFPQGFMV